jgi:hypothetical protein
MAGKDKIERGFRIWFDDADVSGTARDLSGDLLPGSVNGGGKVLDEVEMTGVSDAVKKYLAGHAQAPVSARFHMNDTATTGAFTVLSGMEGMRGTLTLQYGSNGVAPTTGDPEWEGEYVFLGFNVVPDSGKMVLEATFQPASGYADPAWGTVT